MDHPLEEPRQGFAFVGLHGGLAYRLCLVDVFDQVAIDEPLHREREGVLWVPVERAFRVVERDRRIRLQIGRKTARRSQHVPLGKPDMCDRMAGMALRQRLQHVAGTQELARATAVHQSDSAEQQRVAVQGRQRLRQHRMGLRIENRTMAGACDRIADFATFL